MCSDDLNASMREYYTHQPMKNCHLEVYSYCQDGMITINEMQIDFDDGNV